jgi:phosphopantothenoylcysteine decarboxylase/phosphopantothenate--cysteine ligase
MHTEMWRHPATVANIATLRSRGVIMVGPADGELTGGDSGPGRMSEPEQIFEEALAAVATPAGDLTGLRAVVTAGGTREPIDPVRFIGNRSSGKQGIAVALSAADRGADVVLIAAHVDEGVLAEASAHPRLTVLRAGTAIELRDAVTDAAPGADVIVMAAAVADYRVAEVSDAKLAKEAATGPGITLHLIENDDILAGLVRARLDGQTVVGFAAETPGDGETLLDRGRRKAARKGADLLAVNHVGWSRGFESDDNEVVLLDAGGEVVADARGSKREVADALWDAVRKTRAKTK